jgi:predicted methyltransferase
MTRKELAGALRRQLNPRRARWQKPAGLVRALGLRRGQVVAEIGSGPGYFTPRLARAVGPSGHVYAVDPEAAILSVLRRRLARMGVRNVTPVLSRRRPAAPRGRCEFGAHQRYHHHARARRAPAPARRGCRGTPAW